MSSKNKRSDRSHPRMAPPIILASAPLTTSSMSPMNSTPSHVYPSHIPNTRTPSQLDPHLGRLLASPGIPTGLETSTENTHSRSVRTGPGQIVPGHPLHVNAHVPTAHDFGRDIVHILMPDERDVRNSFPHRQDNDANQASRPRELEWVLENPAETSKSSDKKRDALMQRLTIEAGGSCIFCYKSKKKCDPGVSCNRCRQKNLPCVRGSYSSLCMALTIKHEDRYELHPGIFKKAQETLEKLKQYLRPSSFPVVVHWIFRDQQYRETVISAADQLDLRQTDTTLGKTLVDLLNSPQSDLADDLSKYAHRIVGLLSAIKGLSTSVCLTDAPTIKTARVIVFFLMTIYTMEFYEVSLLLAKGLYDALKTISSARQSERHVLVYIKAIDDMVNLQWPNSLMSDIFAQVQPRLQDLQKLLRQLFLDEKFESTSHANRNFDSDLREFDILIGVWSQTQETSVPVDFTQEMRYAVNDLLRSDFNESMENLTTGPQTINPSWLSYQPDQSIATADHDTLTALDSSYYPSIFTDRIANSQNTEITYPAPDTTGFFTFASESTAEYLSEFDLPVPQPSLEDFAYVGDHLS